MTSLKVTSNCPWSGTERGSSVNFDLQLGYNIITGSPDSDGSVDIVVDVKFCHSCQGFNHTNSKCAFRTVKPQVAEEEVARTDPKAHSFTYRFAVGLL